MNDLHHPCEPWAERISLAAAGCLSPDEEREVRRHIETCADCRERFRQLTDLCGTLAEARLPAESVETAIVQRAMSAVTSDESERPLVCTRAEMIHPSRLARSLDTWRWIMRSPVSRTMAAAIFVLAICGVAFWFHGGGAAPVYADFLQPFLDAKTVKYTLTTELASLPGDMMGLTPEAQKDLMHTRAEVMQLDANRSREVSIMPGRSGKTVMIWDGLQGKTLYLYPAEKRATIINQADTPEDNTPNDGPVGYAAMFRSALLDARDKPDVKRESLGEKEIDGRRVVGFRIDRRGEVEFRVWGDPKTGLPVLIEATMAVMPNMKMTMSDFEFNAEMDESLFSVEPPAGYEVEQQQASTHDDSLAEEKDLIEVFRYFSESSGGRFPDSLDMMWLSHTVHMRMWLADSLEQVPTMQHQKEEGAEAQAKIQRGVLFVALLPKEADAHYAGRGVSFGTTDTPIFWYRPKDAEAYRVIYADLSVREAEMPPRKPDAQPEQLEKDLIEMLRQYCRLSGGPFPISLDVGSLFPVLTMKRISGQSMEPNAKQEMTECLVKLQQGLAFTGLLPEEADAYYAGKDVSLGAAKTPIFWYRPQDAKAYRIIYADLSVREVETPPGVPDAQPVPAPSSPKK